MRTLPYFLLRNWWVIAFVVMAWAVYLQAIHTKNRLVAKLEEKVHTLEQARATTLAQRKELILRMQSQDDPEWMELVLKEKLGVVPEGQTKVVFK